MSYGPDYEYFTEPDRANPSETVYLEDHGMSDGDDLWQWIEDYAADDREIVIPSGTYDVGFGYRRISADNCIIRGEEPTGSVVAQVPGGYSESRYQPVLATYDRLELANITIDGTIADSSRSGKLKTEALGSNSYIYVERYRNPDGGANGSGGIFVGGDSRGETMFKDCEVNHSHDNGIYASDPGEGHGNNGPVYVEHGSFFNNNISGVRIGSSNSYVWRVCAGNTEETQYSNSASGSPTNQRSIRIRTGEPRDNLRVIECDVINESLSTSNKAIEIYSSINSGASGEIRNCRITNHDSTSAIRAGSSGDFHAYDNHVTGSGDLDFEIPESGTCRGSGCEEASCDHEEPPAGGGAGGRESDWAQEARLTNSTGYLQDSAMSPNQNIVAYGGSDGIWVHETGSNWELIEHINTEDIVRGIDISDDGYLVAGDDSENLYIYDVGPNNVSQVEQYNLDRRVWIARVSPYNNYLAIWGYQDNNESSRVHILDWEDAKNGTLTTIDTLPHDSGSLRGAAFSPREGEFAFGGSDGTVNIFGINWDTDDFFRRQRLEDYESRVWTIRFSTSSMQILVGYADEQAVVYEYNNDGWYETHNINDATSDVSRGGGWSEDGRFFGYASNDSNGYIYDRHDKSHVASLYGPRTNVVSCEFSGDNKWFGMASLEDGYYVYRIPGKGSMPNVIDTVDGIWQTGPDAVLKTTDVEEVSTLEVDTLQARDITDSSVRLRGEVTEFENVDPADVYFEYGETGSSKQTTGTATIDGTGTFSADLSNLNSDTEYEFEAFAESEGISANGGVETFTTEPGDTIDLIEDFTSDLSNNWSGPNIGTAFRRESDVSFGPSGSPVLHTPEGQGGTNMMTSAPGDGLPNYIGPGTTWEFWFRFSSNGGTRHRAQVYYGFDSSNSGDDVPPDCYGIWLIQNRGHVRLLKRTSGDWQYDVFNFDVDDPHFQTETTYRCVVTQGGTSTNSTHQLDIYRGDTLIGSDSGSDTEHSGEAIGIGNPTEMEGHVWLNDFRIQ